LTTTPVFIKPSYFFLPRPSYSKNAKESRKQIQKIFKSHPDTKSDPIRSATDPYERPAPSRTAISATDTQTIAKEIEFRTRIIYRRCLKPISLIAPRSDLRRRRHPTLIVVVVGVPVSTTPRHLAHQVFGRPRPAIQRSNRGTMPDNMDKVRAAASRTRPQRAAASESSFFTHTNTIEYQSSDTTTITYHPNRPRTDFYCSDPTRIRISRPADITDQSVQ